MEKKDKKKNKKGKKENKVIPQELLNATTIARSMILQDPNPTKESNITEINPNQKYSEPEIQNQTVNTNLNKDTDISDQRINITPIITELIPKKLESTSNQTLSFNLDTKSDYLPKQNVEGSDFSELLETKINQETHITYPEKQESRDLLGDGSKSRDLNAKDSINDVQETFDTITTNNKNPYEITDDKERVIELLKDSTVPHSTRSLLELNLSDVTDDLSRKTGLVTSDEKSTKIPDKISGAVKFSSEINSSELPDKKTGKIVSEKIISGIPDAIHGNSRVTVEKITTEIPNQMAGISKIITEKITTETPDKFTGVSEIVTEKLATELDGLNKNMSTKSFAPSGQSSLTPDSSTIPRNEKVEYTQPNSLSNLTKNKVLADLESIYSPNMDTLKGEETDNQKDFRSAAEEEELTNLEEANELSSDKFNDIIKNLSNSSREDIEQLLAGTLSQDPGVQDEKLTNLLIDMLIEQETMKLAASGDLPPDLDSEDSDLEETTSTNQNSENSVIEVNPQSKDQESDVSNNNGNVNLKPHINMDKVKTISKESSEPVFTTFTDFSGETSGAEGNSSPKPYITTPTLSRRGIGGSQRYSREERPVLIEISKRYDNSSSDEEDDRGENSRYVVTEPSPTVNKRKVTFKFDSEDPDTMSDDVDDDEGVHIELVDEKKEEKKKELPVPPKLSRSSSTDSTSSKRNSIEIPKLDDLQTLKKVERKFERMASETLEDSSLAKGAVEGEFQRLMSQLSHEEMDECLLVWNESELAPIGEAKCEDAAIEEEDDGGMTV